MMSCYHDAYTCITKQMYQIVTYNTPTNRFGFIKQLEKEMRPTQTAH